MAHNRLTTEFFTKDVLEVAPELLGNFIVRRFDDGSIQRYLINEVEAYRGEEDLACHASKGRTKRTEIMYHEGGHLYVYLIYGMYWMLNVVTGDENNPQAILIRGVDHFNGPGKLTKQLKINNSFYGENLTSSDRIWIENSISTRKKDFKVLPRVGIDYAGDLWKNKPWRYVLLNS